MLNLRETFGELYRKDELYRNIMICDDVMTCRDTFEIEDFEIQAQILNMALSGKKRYELKFLQTHRLGPKLSAAAAAKEVGCSLNTAKKWRNWDGEPSVEDAPRSGAPRKTSAAEDKKLSGSLYATPQHYPRPSPARCRG
jgi:hypothetical protein